MQAHARARARAHTHTFAYSKISRPLPPCIVVHQRCPASLWPLPPCIESKTYPPSIIEPRPAAVQRKTFLRRRTRLHHAALESQKPLNPLSTALINLEMGRGVLGRGDYPISSRRPP